MSNIGAPAQVLETRPYSRELVASIVCGVALVDGPGPNELIGYIVGHDPAEFVGLHRPHITHWVNAANWLVEQFPELEPLHSAPHNLVGALDFLGELDLPESFNVPRRPNAGPWLPAEEPAGS